MLDPLKFVQGSVSKKDLVPELTHFVIEAGTVRGYNGQMALSAPLPFDLDCKPKAAPLLAAISKCNETIQLAMTSAGKLSIKSGKFKAHIECIQGDTVHVLPEGETYPAIPGLVQILKTVAPFIGNDASRPWSNGVMLKGCSAYATNNVAMVEHWLSVEIPWVVNIPAAAVKEILRIGEDPVGIQYDGRSMTFHYAGGEWLRTQLFSTDWPPIEKVFKMNEQCNPAPVPEGFFEALNDLRPFADKLSRVFFNEGEMTTVAGNVEEGASYSVPGVPAGGIYNIEMLRLLEGTATSIDLSRYPEPCPFFGDKVRGLVVGMRQ